ncbi:MAG: DUF2490 domain-containing protein [Aureispira sp.]
MKINSFVLFLFLLFNTPLKSQNIEIQQDFSIWFGFQLEKKLPNNFELSLEQQLRTWMNTTRIDKYWAAVDLKHMLNKNFSINASLRYIHDSNKWQRPHNSLRYNLGIQFKRKISKKLRIFYRIQYQQKFTHNHRTFTFKETTATRHKIKLQLKIKKKNKFYFSTETFIRSDILTKNYFDKQRFLFGDKINTKIGSFDTGIGYEINLKPNHFSSIFFLKLAYTIDL